jgi:hypothetical protein
LDDATGLRREVLLMTMVAVVGANDRRRVMVVQGLKKMVHAVGLGGNQKNQEQER